MRKFLIYLSIYFCLTCFGLSFSPSSEAGVQFRQWFKSPGYGVSLRARIELNCSVIQLYPGPNVCVSHNVYCICYLIIQFILMLSDNTVHINVIVTLPDCTRLIENVVLQVQFC
jgi:hypothetical protein